jgi:hypothetical protein
MPAKHTRKPPKVISPEVWKAIETVIVAGGLGWTEAGRQFNIEPHAIQMRAKRYAWPVGSKIAKTAEALRKSVTERAVCKAQRNNNERAAEIIAECWAQKGERHKLLAFDFAHRSLRQASKAGLPIKDWAEAEKADRMARRAANLDADERSTQISVGLNLICARIDAQLGIAPPPPAPQALDAETGE